MNWTIRTSGISIETGNQQTLASSFKHLRCLLLACHVPIIKQALVEYSRLQYFSISTIYSKFYWNWWNFLAVFGINLSLCELRHSNIDCVFYISASNGIVLAAEKKQKSILYDDTTIHKVCNNCKISSLIHLMYIWYWQIYYIASL